MSLGSSQHLPMLVQEALKRVSNAFHCFRFFKPSNEMGELAQFEALRLLHESGMLPEYVQRALDEEPMLRRAIVSAPWHPSDPIAKSLTHLNWSLIALRRVVGDLTSLERDALQRAILVAARCTALIPGSAEESIREYADELLSLRVQARAEEDRRSFFRGGNKAPARGASATPSRSNGSSSGTTETVKAVLGLPDACTGESA